MALFAAEYGEAFCRSLIARCVRCDWVSKTVIALHGISRELSYEKHS